MPTESRSVSIEFTAEFEHNLQKLAKKYSHIRSDLEPIIGDLSNGATPGVQVRGVGYAIYKVRVRNRDIRKGKSSGYRVIYWMKTPTLVILVTVYSKTEQSDISPTAIRRIVGETKG